MVKVTVTVFSRDPLETPEDGVSEVKVPTDKVKAIVIRVIVRETTPVGSERIELVRIELNDLVDLSTGLNISQRDKPVAAG